MGRFVASLIVTGIALALVFVPSPARACSCAEASPDALLENADVVFVGAPVRLVLEADGPQGVERLWEFDIAGVYHGEVTQGIAVSGGSGGDGGCEVAFDEDFGDVAVAARWSSGHLRTGSCSTMSAATFVAAMGPGNQPITAGDDLAVVSSTSGPPAALVGLAIAAVALALAGLAAIAWGRRSATALGTGEETPSASLRSAPPPDGEA